MDPKRANMWEANIEEQEGQKIKERRSSSRSRSRRRRGSTRKAHDEMTTHLYRRYDTYLNTRYGLSQGRVEQSVV